MDLGQNLLSRTTTHAVSGRMSVNRESAECELHDPTEKAVNFAQREVGSHATGLGLRLCAARREGQRTQFCILGGMFRTRVHKIPERLKRESGLM